MKIVFGKVSVLSVQKQNKLYLGEEYANKRFRNNTGYLSFSKFLEPFKNKRIALIIVVDKGWEAEIKNLKLKGRNKK